MCGWLANLLSVFYYQTQRLTYSFLATTFSSGTSPGIVFPSTYLACNLRQWNSLSFTSWRGFASDLSMHAGT